MATRYILPHLDLELEADRSAVPPLSVQSRLGVLGVVETTGAKSTTRRAFGRRGRAPPSRIRFDNAAGCVVFSSLGTQSLTVPRQVVWPVRIASPSQQRLSEGVHFHHRLRALVVINMTRSARVSRAKC
jgi:hypothetical protein